MKFLKTFLCILGVLFFNSVNGQNVHSKNRTKDTIFLKLDTKYFFSNDRDPELFFVKGVLPTNATGGFFFGVKNITLSKEPEKILDLKEFLEPSDFYSKEKGYLTKITSFSRFLEHNYVVYLVEECKRNIFYEVYTGFVVE